ncbi:DegV family EDD domain-containing protein [bacterium]|nr:DegV family EDD domain-containing protein [bacterium]
MKPIGLVTDNICSLPENIIKEYQIEIVKTKLYFPEAEKFPEKNLYQVMQETKAFPKTSSPSPGDFLKAYKKALKKFEKILVITLSSKLSATFNSAFQAKQLLPDPSKVILFDSLQAVATEGLLVLEAAELLKNNKEIKEVLDTLEKLKTKTKLFGFLKTTYWVEKIGRISSLQAAAFKILNGLGILPIIGINKGKVGLTGFNFWTKEVLKALFHQIKHQLKRSKVKVAINYTDNITLAYQLKEKIEKGLKLKVAFISLVPPIVGANSGPGTLIAGTMPEIKN